MSRWKPKERELTGEEAVELAKKQLEPNWFGSPPLFTAIRVGDKANLYPLEPKALDTEWLIWIIDPSTYDGKMGLKTAVEIDKNYSQFGIKNMLIIVPNCSYLKEEGILKRISDAWRIKFPIVNDTDKNIAAAFGATTLPKVLMFEKQRTTFSYDKKGAYRELEQFIQTFIRKNDPGLPLFPIAPPAQNILSDAAQVSFGKGKVKFAKIQKVDPASKASLLDEGAILYTGEWNQTEDAISTADPAAELVFKSPFPEAALVAGITGKGTEACKIMLEIDDLPIIDLFAGATIGFDDLGQSFCNIRLAQLYELTTKLPENLRVIKIKFPNSKRVPLTLYGLRFSK